MTEVPKRIGSKYWLAAAIVAVVAVPLLAFGFQAGGCVDYVAEAAAESFCTTGPAVDLAAAWTLSAAAVLFAGYALRRGFSTRR
jgi:hypothetical protein